MVIGAFASSISNGSIRSDRTARGLLRIGLACLMVFGLVGVAVAQSTDNSVSAETKKTDDDFDLVIDNPLTIVEQGKQDDKRKDSLIRVPGIDRLFQPWEALRADLLENYGFRPGISFTNLTQWASDKRAGASEDVASGFELVIDGTWTFRGRGGPSPSIAGFEILWRDKIGTDIPPAALFTQTGALYPSAVAFGELGPAIGQLWYEQRFDGRFGFRVGKFFPLAVYDFFPLKNFRTDFVDPIQAANIAIPLPDRGLGGFALFRPRPDMYVRAGFHDANANAEKTGFDTLFDEGELFTILEVGIDPGLAERQPERPPPGDVHVSFWHQDKRDDAGVDDGWGLVVAGSQRFGRFLPFLRYGYSDSHGGGPSILKHMVNGGLAIDAIFGQTDDRIGIGLTWAEPADGSLNDQKAIDMFYRIQVTPRIAVSPTLQVVFDPPRNPDEDSLFVAGIRTRVAF